MRKTIVIIAGAAAGALALTGCGASSATPEAAAAVSSSPSSASSSAAAEPTPTGPAINERIRQSFVGIEQRPLTDRQKVFIMALIYSDMSRPYWNSPDDGLLLGHGVCVELTANDMWDTPDVDPTLELIDSRGWDVTDAYIFSDAAQQYLCSGGTR